MSDIHKHLNKIRGNSLNPLTIQKIDAEFKVTIIDFLNEQRTLIKQQATYTKWTMGCTIAIAIATVVYAFFEVLHFFIK